MTYTGPDRRQRPRPPVVAASTDPAVQWLIDYVDTLYGRIDELEEKNAAIDKECKELRAGFTDGKPGKHHDWHEAIESTSGVWRERRKKLIDAMFNGAGISIALFVLYAIGDALKAKFIGGGP